MRSHQHRVAPVKQPVHDTRQLPVCYGLSYVRDELRCRDCAARKECSAICRRWSDRLSISEQLARAEAAAAPERHADDLPRLYDELYRAQFGRRSRRKSTEKNARIFERVARMCGEEEIDPATFIAANMEMLADAEVLGRFGFQPNMLSGEKAKARYNIYLRRSNRRFRRGDLQGFKSATKLGELREHLWVSEYVVGEYFVRSAIVGEPVTWEAAIEHVRPYTEWEALRLARGPLSRRWATCLGGDEAVARELDLAQLKAAVMVAESLQTGLSNRVSCTRWSWEKFAALATRLFASEPLETLDLSDVEGVAYA